ncbi:NAD(P)H-binding protein [Congregibacter variabilis]|uniref:Divinyl chlorophyllide a 8-vinyl-reductase, chloroplastic n=1 Tax=Congregibacter variabilis TaxID=3081200 RepID=A0ABZ0I361_9GAMM|nr:NAD(P)H-binding protein [Congregibacter sp. IMCC43200]
MLEHGFTLICPVRDPKSSAAQTLSHYAATVAPGRLSVVTAKLDDERALTKVLKPFRADSLVSCIASRSGGIADSEAVEYRANHNLLRWASSTQVKHFTLLSAICVQKPRLAFQFAKLRFETELAASGLSYTSVRATAFFKSLSGQLQRVKRGKPFLMFGDGLLTRCKPIAESDLAHFIRLSLESPELRGVQAIGGPGPEITPLGQAQLLARLTQQPLRTQSVSPKLLVAAASALSVPGRISARIADKAEFARIGHYYATESMLLWNGDRQAYDAAATPEFGSITLEESYRAQLAGTDKQSLGQQAVFR